jgi:hypothetical protein
MITGFSHSSESVKEANGRVDQPVVVSDQNFEFIVVLNFFLDYIFQAFLKQKVFNEEIVNILKHF